MSNVNNTITLEQLSEMVRQLVKLREDVYEELDRLRTAKLDDFESFSENVSFHIGYMDAAMLRLIDLMLSTGLGQRE